MSTKPLNDPTNQSDAEASFWAKAERNAEKSKSETPPTPIPTPRTDGAVLEKILCGSGDEEYTVYPVEELVPAEHARELEAELTEAKNGLEMASKVILSHDTTREKDIEQLAQLTAQLAAVTAEREELKKQLAEANSPTRRYGEWQEYQKLELLLDDCATLCRRLVRALGSEHHVGQSAMAFLQENDLTGTPLQEGAPQSKFESMDAQLAAQSEQLRRMREALVPLAAYADAYDAELVSRGIAIPKIHDGDDSAVAFPAEILLPFLKIKLRPSYITMRDAVSARNALADAPAQQRETTGTEESR